LGVKTPQILLNTKMSEILSKENCLSHYKWGENCDGWNFVSKPAAVIKQELMPPALLKNYTFIMLQNSFSTF